jgi:drug/metabolite transporter (DMT)-like permease
MLWFWMAVLGAAGYGFSYAVAEKLSAYLSAATILLLSYILSLFFYLFFLFKEDYRQELTAATEPVPAMWLVLYTLGVVVANMAVLEAIRLKSGTAAAIVETSVPLFAAVAAFLIFRTVQLSPPLLVGGGLIFSGLAVIYVWR